MATRVSAGVSSSEFGGAKQVFGCRFLDNLKRWPLWASELRWAARKRAWRERAS